MPFALARTWEDVSFGGGGAQRRPPAHDGHNCGGHVAVSGLPAAAHPTPVGTPLPGSAQLRPRLPSHEFPRPCGEMRGNMACLAPPTGRPGGIQRHRPKTITQRRRSLGPRPCRSGSEAGRAGTNCPPARPVRPAERSVSVGRPCGRAISARPLMRCGSATPCRLAPHCRPVAAARAISRRDRTGTGTGAGAGAGQVPSRAAHTGISVGSR